MPETYVLEIYRGEPGHQYWEEFELSLVPSANVISALMEIQRHPVNRRGERVTPVAWESGCLEEVCGSCSMLIEGRPRQACTALIEGMLQKTGERILRLAPLTKFPLVRDLVVDRSRLFEDLKRIRGWIDGVSTVHPCEPGPPLSPEKQKILYNLSTCMSCGCCSEACPQVNAHSSFIGPAAISQARLFNANPVGAMQRARRLRPLMEEGGISECGNNQNCAEVCPKNIALTDSIGVISREVKAQALRDFLSFPDQEGY